MNQEKTFLDEDEHQQATKEFNQKLAKDLKKQKKEEENQKELSTERRRWFNKQINKYTEEE